MCSYVLSRALLALAVSYLYMWRVLRSRTMGAVGAFDGTLAQGGRGGGVGPSHIWMVPVHVCTDHFLKTNFIPHKGHLATQ